MKTQEKELALTGVDVQVGALKIKGDTVEGGFLLPHDLAITYNDAPLPMNMVTKIVLTVEANSPVRCGVEFVVGASTSP